ncbi:hypothetical protein FB451DRAFT_1155051 [Mycena latifolia]|nr:hypothetical protein FB451DRAFT_1155051 [Mycena latifolia]
MSLAMHPSQTFVAHSTELPTEVWVRCWSLCSPRDLRRLVFVSRHFRDICQPLLFQNQEFRTQDPEEISRENWIETTRGLHRSSLRLKKLAASVHVSSVKSWHFQGDADFLELPDRFPNVANIGVVVETYSNVVSTFVDTLGAYHNLRSLRVSCLTIDAEFRGILATLARLDELHLNLYDIVGRTGALLSLKSFTLQRLGFSADHDCFDEPLHILSPGTLRVMKLDDCRDSRALLSVLANEAEPFHNLVTLSIEVSDSAANSFIAFLLRCPQLTRLTISGSSLICDRLPPNAIPLLQSFTGPRPLASSFISGRPVSSLEFSDGRGFFVRDRSVHTDLIRDLSDIGPSSATVRSLSIVSPTHNALDVLTVIATTFPDLEHLDFALADPPAQTAVPTYYNLTANDESDSASSTDESEVDERTVELSESGSLESIRSVGRPDLAFATESADTASSADESEVDGRTLELAESGNLEDVRNLGSPDLRLISDGSCESEAKTANSPPVFDILQPGYIYMTSGAVYDPPLLPETSAGYNLNSISGVLERICAEGTTLPPALASMRFTKTGFPGFSRLMLTIQHRAILTLERQQPSLGEVEFDEGIVWTRYRDVWTQKGSGTKIMSQARRRE